MAHPLVRLARVLAGGEVGNTARMYTSSARASPSFKSFVPAPDWPSESAGLGGAIGPCSLPPELAKSTKAVLSSCGLSRKQLKRDVSAIHDFLFTREVSSARAPAGTAPSKYLSAMQYGDREAVAFLAGRQPVCYAATLRALAELKARAPAGWAPASVLDFGSGLGTTSWAIDTLWGSDGDVADDNGTPIPNRSKMIDYEDEEDAGEGNGDAGAGAGGDISGGSDGLLLPFGGDVRPGYPEIVCVEPSLEMFDLASVLASTGPVNKLNFHRESCSRTLMVRRSEHPTTVLSGRQPATFCVC